MLGNQLSRSKIMCIILSMKLSESGGYINTAACPTGAQPSYPQCTYLPQQAAPPSGYPQYTYPLHHAGPPGEYTKNNVMPQQSALPAGYPQNSDRPQGSAPPADFQQPPPYTESKPPVWDRFIAHNTPCDMSNQVDVRES